MSDDGPNDHGAITDVAGIQVGHHSDPRRPTGLGVLEIGGPGHDRIVAFREKPTESFSVSMGIYALSRDTLATYEPGAALGFDELVLDLLDTPTQPRVHPFGGYWLDIGRPDDYDTANEEWDRLRPLLLPNA